MRVVFFNHFHNGDIHLSRGFVRQIINKVQQIDPNVQFAFGHKNASNLLIDIPNLSFDSNVMSIIRGEHAGIHTVGDTVYINTWYGQQNFKYMNRYGIAMDTLYSIYNDACKSLWGFSLEDISTDPSIFFPTIDYSKYETEAAKTWLDANPMKKIFVSNGMPLSDQAHYFALTPIIDTLSKKHPDKMFILSNNDGHPGSANIIHSSQIIQKEGNDLNENSFISSYCDVIIGKSSGSFTFAMTHENYFKRNINILAFCNLTPVYPNKDYWIGELLRNKIQYKAKVIVDNEKDTNQIMNIIDNHL
jgi:hypothetical protein